MPRTEHSPLYTKPNGKPPLKLAAFTDAIKGAESDQAALKLLAEKQAALDKLPPPRRSRRPPGRCEEVQEAETESGIKDSGLRLIYERAKAREERPPARPLAVPDISQVAKFESIHAALEPVKPTPPVTNSVTNSPVTHTGPYAHGAAMRETLARVSMRPDLTWRAKALAMTLAAHFPNIRPTVERLKLLTGIRSNKTISLGLIELKNKKLLRWDSGKADRANEYTCLWLKNTPS